MRQTLATAYVVSCGSQERAFQQASREEGSIYSSSKSCNDYHTGVATRIWDMTCVSPQQLHTSRSCNNRRPHMTSLSSKFMQQSHTQRLSARIGRPSHTSSMSPAPAAFSYSQMQRSGSLLKPSTKPTAAALTDASNEEADWVTIPLRSVLTEILDPPLSRPSVATRLSLGSQTSRPPSPCSPTDVSVDSLVWSEELDMLSDTESYSYSDSDSDSDNDNDNDLILVKK